MDEPGATPIRYFFAFKIRAIVRVASIPQLQLSAFSRVSFVRVAPEYACFARVSEADS